VVQASGIVTVLTDFGARDAYVGAMKGAILSVFPKAVIVDITHGVRPFAILEGAFLLDSSWRSFPEGTVHLCVVDPGVGGSRRELAFQAAGHFFVGPDNGLFSYVNERRPPFIDLPVPATASPTFHGRDVFGPAAARLASGVALEQLGSPTDEPPVRLPEANARKVGGGWEVHVLHIDHFGNVITNLPGHTLSQLRAVNGTPVRTVRSYEGGDPDELIALTGSSGRIELAIREGSAAERVRATPGERLRIT
jgi:S-adenosylmethionine hydrolase